MCSGSRSPRPRRRKCRYCKAYFVPDPRNASRQKACPKEACRKARQRESQEAWLSKPENLNYFRGPDNVERVRRWRREHPNYGRRQSLPKPSQPLQDTLNPEVVDNKPVKASLTEQALQDALTAQVPLLLGLIAHMIGSSLQDDIVSVLHRMIDRGSAILGPKGSGQAPLNRHPNAYEKETIVVTPTGSSDPPALELDRSPPGG